MTTTTRPEGVWGFYVLLAAVALVVILSLVWFRVAQAPLRGGTVGVTVRSLEAPERESR
jgi:hypothetical protein